LTSILGHPREIEILQMSFKDLQRHGERAKTRKCWRRQTRSG
jgi:hypothetical protein